MTTTNDYGDIATPCIVCGDYVPIGKDCPACRAREIIDWLERADDDIDAARLARARLMAQLRAEGMGNAEIGELFGISRVRVIQILRALTVLERAPFAILAEYHN